MPPQLWWILTAVGVGGAVLLFVWRPLRIASREARFVQRRKRFHWQRERLEAKFVQLASARAVAEGPNWEDCLFDDDVAYVRDRRTGELAAFVAVIVPMDDRDQPTPFTGKAVGRVRAGTAVFRFDRDHWSTDGRAIPNLSPTEAIRVYQKDLEVVDQELARRV